MSRKYSHDSGLYGVALTGTAIVLSWAMHAPPNASGVIWPYACSPLFSGFGEMAWLVPISLGLVGAILVLEHCDHKIMRAMGLASFCYLILFSTMLQVGGIGIALSRLLYAATGTMREPIIYALLGVLTFAMSGLSLRRTTVRAASALWEARLPAIDFSPRVLFSASSEVVEEAVIVPMALPVRRVEPERPSSVARPVVRESHSTSIVSAYELPSLSLFNAPEARKIEPESKERVIVDCLASFKIGVTVTNRIAGSSITRYELLPNKGVAVDRITKRADDIALALAAQSVRIEAPIPGKAAVGIEVPNAVPSTIVIREVLAALPKRDGLHVALGKDIDGKSIIANLCDMPHLLVAGATGAGKSVCLNSIIASLLVSYTPDQLQLLMIDPKRVELTIYNGVPHLIREVITDCRLAVGALNEIAKEMDSRYQRFQDSGLRNITEFNQRFPGQKLPYLVVVIDELYDLMLIAKDKVETIIARLASLARATGIHLVVATQRPSVDVVTGLIKANIPSRIAFAVSAQVDSRTILDEGGAEKLLGRGDMLFAPIGAMKPQRLQGAFITGEEVHRLVGHWKRQSTPANIIDIEAVPIAVEEQNLHPLTLEAARYAIELGQASTAGMQAQFQIGHPSATRLMKSLEDLGVVGPANGKKPRTILMSATDLDSMRAKELAC